MDGKNRNVQTYEMAPLIGIDRHRLATDGVGVTTLVAFHGCPLQCKFCLNEQCLAPEGIWEYYTTKQLLEAVMVDNMYFLATGGGITFSGGEPLLRSHFIKEFCILMPQTWHITLETSLNVSLKHLQEVAPFIGNYIVDIKDMDAEVYKSYTTLNNIRVKDNLRWLVAQGIADRVTVRIPLIPDHNDDAFRNKSEHELRDMGYLSFDKFDYIRKN